MTFAKGGGGSGSKGPCEGEVSQLSPIGLQMQFAFPFAPLIALARPRLTGGSVAAREVSARVCPTNSAKTRAGRCIIQRTQARKFNKSKTRHDGDAQLGYHRRRRRCRTCRRGKKIFAGNFTLLIPRFLARRGAGTPFRLLLFYVFMRRRNTPEGVERPSPQRMLMSLIVLAGLMTTGK